jgi:AraC family transcriptional regulator
LTLSVEPETFARLAPELASGSLAQFTNATDPIFTRLPIDLRQATLLGAAISPLAFEALVAAAIQRVSELLNGGTPRAGPGRRMTSRRLKRILDYFEARLAEEVHLADIADDIGLSESYLARTFKAATGTTLHAALTERRIARARLLIGAALRRGVRANLADIAAATGFSSHAHMTTAFRRVLGITPTEWLRLVEPAPELQRVCEFNTHTHRKSARPTDSSR